MQTRRQLCPLAQVRSYCHAFATQPAHEPFAIVVAGCETWCAGNKQDWKQKCSWIESCGGCARCKSNTTPLPTMYRYDKCSRSVRIVVMLQRSERTHTSFEIVVGCQKWCAANKQAWKRKCTWASLCDGCPGCAGASHSRCLSVIV